MIHGDNLIYVRINWENYPSDETPLNELNLNKMDLCLHMLDERAVWLNNNKFDKLESFKLVKNVDLNEETGIFTITYYDNTFKEIDTILEKIATNWDYDESAQQLVITLDDGTVKKVDLSALITQYEFMTSDTIFFEIQADGKVKAIVREGSIQEKHLRPDYLADIKVEAAKALTSQEAAAESAIESKSYAIGGTGTRESEETDNAKYYKEQAKIYYDNLEQARIVTGVKGNSESTYRTGNVNITKANIGLGNVENERQYSASNPQASVTGSSGSCTGNSATATKLLTPRTIDGVSFDGSTDIVHFGTCNTAASSKAKFVSIPGFQLIQGAIVFVYFAAGNSAENPTLNVSNTGAKDIVDKDGVITGNEKYYIVSRATYCFVYTGSLWELDAKIDTNKNTVSFTNADTESPAAWTNVSVLSSGLTHSTLFNRISTMFKNIRYLYKLLGKTDISEIEDGTVTGAINKMHTDLSDLNAKSYSGWFRQKIGNMVEINASVSLTISGTLSESTGTYFYQAKITMPAQIRPTDSTYMNVQSTVQSPGVFNSTFAGYNNGSGILTFNIATWKPFQNANIYLHVRIRFNE